jgi:hypothetical protein
LFIHVHKFTFRPLCLHSITKILRNGPRAHFPFMPSVSGAETSGSRSEEQGQAEGVLDPLAEVVEVTPGSQADLSVSQERSLVPAVQEVDPRAVVTAHGQAVPSAPRAPEVGTTSKPAAGRTSAAPAGTEARGASLQA